MLPKDNLAVSKYLLKVTSMHQSNQCISYTTGISYVDFKKDFASICSPILGKILKLYAIPRYLHFLKIKYWYFFH